MHSRLIAFTTPSTDRGKQGVVVADRFLGCSIDRSTPAAAASDTAARLRHPHRHRTRHTTTTSIRRPPSMLEEQDDFAAINPPGPPATDGNKTRAVHFLGRPLLKIETAWGVGIGGDIWTTGSLLCQFLERRHGFFQRVFRGARILELGSGTGLVGLCVASPHAGFDFAEVVITDQADHLPLIRRNVRANGLLPLTDEIDDNSPNPSPACTQPPTPKRRLRVQEFDWVSGAGVGSLGPRPFDVVLGTDVAYCPELYAPVVKALETVAGPRTLVILGVTRSDTGPAFFSLLRAAGFDYCLLRTDDLDGAGGGVASGFALISVVRRGGDVSVAGQ